MDGILSTPFPGQLFVGDPGDHLVHIHIGLRAAAGLEDGQRELIIVLAPADRLGRILDGIAQLYVQSVGAIDARGGLFDSSLRMDDLQRHPLMLGKGEVLQAALRLRPPVSLGGDFDGPDGIGFGACLGHCELLLCPPNPRKAQEVRPNRGCDTLWAGSCRRWTHRPNRLSAR